MKKFLLIFGLLFGGLTACTQLGTDNPTELVQNVETPKIVNMGAVTAHIYKKYTLNTLNKGFRYAKVEWQNADGSISGSDNVYASNSPDRVNLGSDDGITLKVVAYK